MHQLRGGSRTPCREHGVPVALGDGRIEQVRLVELAEHVLRDHERPHVRVVDRRVAVEMAERGLEMRVRHRRVGRVLGLEVTKDPVGVHFRRRPVVVVERDRRIEVLVGDRRGAAEPIRAAHPLHHLGRDRLAGLVLGEGLQHAGIPAPFLQHLRRSFDEIPLRRDSRDRLPGLVSSEHGMKQVAELVEERHDVTVLHQSRIAFLPAGEVADERRFGNLDSRDAVPDAEIRGVVVFPRPRMKVQVEASDHAAVFPYFVALDARIPNVRVRHPLVRHAEHLRGRAEDAVLHLVEGEVRAGLLRVEIVVALPDQLAVVAAIPLVHRLGRGLVLALSLEIRLVFLLRALQGQPAQSLDEGIHVFVVPDHLVAGGVFGPRLEPEELRQLVAPGDHPVQDRHVGGIGAIQELVEQVLAYVRLLGVAHDGEEVRVLDADRDLPVRSRRMRLDVILREAVQIGGALEGDRARVIPDILVELLADRHQLLTERGDLLARGFVFVDTREPEVPKRLLDRKARGRIHALEVERAQRVVHAAVQSEIVQELARGAGLRLGHRAHRGVGMDRLDQARGVRGVVGMEQRFVVWCQRVLDRPGALDLEEAVERPARDPELAVREGAEARGVGTPGPEGRRDRRGRRGRSRGFRGECRRGHCIRHERAQGDDSRGQER